MRVHDILPSLSLCLPFYPSPVAEAGNCLLPNCHHHWCHTHRQRDRPTTHSASKLTNSRVLIGVFVRNALAPCDDDAPAPATASETRRHTSEPSLSSFLRRKSISLSVHGIFSSSCVSVCLSVCKSADCTDCHHRVFAACMLGSTASAEKSQRENRVLSTHSLFGEANRPTE